MKLAPQFPYLPYNLGLLFQRINRIRDAAAQYQKALDTAVQSEKDLVLFRSDGREPEKAEALNALGTLMEEAKYRASSANSMRTPLQPIAKCFRQGTILRS